MTYRDTQRHQQKYLSLNTPITTKDGKYMAKRKEELKVIPLGGMSEIGKNMTAFEYGNDIMIIDCGMAFPDEDMLGVPNVLAIPHLGASTEEAEDNCAKMAVDETRNFLENGNIINSVNYPNVDMGVCTSAGRVTICHKNIANMITKFTAAFGDQGINIENMMNKSRGDYAYTVLDIESPATTQMVEELQAIEGVFKVRVVK